MITSICLICFQEIIDNLDQETLVKVAKEGFMSRPLVLKDIIEKNKRKFRGNHATSKSATILCVWIQFVRGSQVSSDQVLFPIGKQTRLHIVCTS